MTKKQENQPSPTPENPPQPTPPTASPSSGAFEERLAALEKRMKHHEELAEIRKRLHDDVRVTLVCLLNAVKKAQEVAGVSLMPKGTYYGVKFS